MTLKRKNEKTITNNLTRRDYKACDKIFKLSCNLKTQLLAQNRNDRFTLISFNHCKLIEKPTQSFLFRKNGGKRKETKNKTKH